MTTLPWFLVNNKVLYFFTLQTTHFPLGLPFRLSSLLLFLTKTRGRSHKKVYWTKTSTCRDGILKNQANKMGMTPQHFHTIPTSCAILPSMLNKWTSHSLLFTHQPSWIQDICHVQQQYYTTYTLTCNKTQHCLCTPQRLTVSTMLSSNCIAATHNTTYSPCTSTCTTHTALLNPLPSATLICTQHKP